MDLADLLHVEKPGPEGHTGQGSLSMTLSEQVSPQGQRAGGRLQGPSKGRMGLTAHGAGVLTPWAMRLFWNWTGVVVTHTGDGLNASGSHTSKRLQ